MQGYYGNIVKITENNTYFRKVLFTGKYCQLVVMNLKPGEEIGMEVHKTVDQFFRFEKGDGKVTIDGKHFEVKDDLVVVVPAGSKHNIINTSKTKSLKLYTVYSPPNHPQGTVHKTKADALKAEAREHH